MYDETQDDTSWKLTLLRVEEGAGLMRGRSAGRGILALTVGFPGGASGKEPACQCGRQKRHAFDPWVRKIPWERAWQPTPVFLPGESPWTEEPGGLQSMGSRRVGHD